MALPPFRPHAAFRLKPLGRRGIALSLLAALACCAIAACGAGARYASGAELRTGLVAYPPFKDGDGRTILARTRGLGAQLVKLVVNWSTVAPTSPPPGFNAANPGDPAYRWAATDSAVLQAVADGLTPVIDVEEPPSWAQSPPGSGATHPDIGALTSFTAAMAARYDGATAGLPRVSYWEVWNEPNASYFLQPQIEGSTFASVETYRAMVNAVSAAVHAVRPDNIVIGGALFPNGLSHSNATAIAPLEFTRRLFCISAGSKPHRVCDATVNVDAWSVHPYTSGGPSTLPANPDNVWISSLRSLTSTVRAAQRLKTLVSAHRASLWVSEFSWDSNPPDPKGVGVGLEQRWVAEALYRAWRAGFEAFVWFRLDDEPLSSSPFQAGLYFECPGGLSCETQKPAAAAFRFPFVAYAQRRRRVLVWGRTPSGVRARVRVQWLDGSRWATLATLRTDADDIFTADPKLPSGASSSSAALRASLGGATSPATLGGATSPAFSLNRPPEIIVSPFG